MHERFKELRRALGLKQREIAAAIGVTTSTYGAWECASDKPGAARIYSICQRFGVNEEWLRDGRGPMFNRDKTLPDRRAAQREFCRDVFACLPVELQKVVLDALKEEAAKHAPTKTSSKIQVNNGTVGGDMIQE